MPQLPINIDNLLHQRTIESERIEYKKGWNPESVLHTLCAFANDFHNLGGGYVVIGVTEENGLPILPPVGVELTQIDKIQKQLLNFGNSAIQPPYHPLTAVYEIQGKHILVLWVPGGETRPYKVKTHPNNKKSEWAYYVRKHTSTVKATGETERELLSLAATVPLADITRQALSYIKTQYLKEAVVKYPDRAEAERFWNFPYAAIEEAVVNAVYHRSYEIREPIEIRFDADELVVLSFPGPDRSINLKDLQAGKAVSRRYRNRRIGEFLKELDLTEGRSTGLPKILRVMRKNGSPAPIFETDEERSYFLIRLPIHSKFVDLKQVTDQVIDQVTDQVAGLLSALLQDEKSTKELMQVFGLKHRPTFLKNYLQPAILIGLVEMTQPESPRSPTQAYRLTPLGEQVIASL